ncbi:hypothetical protein Tco_0449386 [Tanacetum coccineum]
MPGRPRKKRVRSKGEGGSSTRVSKIGSILEETGQEYDFTPKEGLNNKSQMVETPSGKLATPSRSASNCVRKVVTASELSRHNETLEDSTARRHQDFLRRRHDFLKLNSILESLNLIPSSRCSGVVCKKEKDSDVMLIKLIKNNDCPNNEEMEEDDDVLDEEEFRGDHFNKFLTRSELTYHKYLMSAPIPSMILSNPITIGGNHLNLKIPCNIGHVHIGRDYIDLDFPLNIKTRTLYNWIRTNPLEPRKDSKSPSGISNLPGEGKR